MKAGDIAKFKAAFQQRLNAHLITTIAKFTEALEGRLGIKELARKAGEGLDAGNPIVIKLNELTTQLEICTEGLKESIIQATNGIPANPNVALELRKLEEIFFSKITALPGPVALAAKSVFQLTIKADPKLLPTLLQVQRCTEGLEKSIVQATNGIPANPNVELELQKLEDAFFSELTVLAARNRSNPATGLPGPVAFAVQGVFSSLLQSYLPAVVPRAQAVVPKAQAVVPDQKREAEIPSTLPLKPLVTQILEIKQAIDERAAQKAQARRDMAKRVEALDKKMAAWVRTGGGWQQGLGGRVDALTAEERTEFFGAALAAAWARTGGRVGALTAEERTGLGFFGAVLTEAWVRMGRWVGALTAEERRAFFGAALAAAWVRTGGRVGELTDQERTGFFRAAALATTAWVRTGGQVELRFELTEQERAAFFGALLAEEWVRTGGRVELRFELMQEEKNLRTRGRETSFDAELRRACAATVLTLKTHYRALGEALSEERIEAIIKEMKGLILDQIIEQANQAHLVLRAYAVVVMSLKAPYGEISEARIEATMKSIKGLVLDQQEAQLVLPGAKEKYEETKALTLAQLIAQADKKVPQHPLVKQKYEGAKRNYKDCYSGTGVSVTSVEPITAWLKTNRNELVATDSSVDNKVLAESRRYLSNWESNVQAAWRNFDVGAPIKGTWRRMLVGIGNGTDADLMNIRECRESLAYYYTAFTDPRQVPTAEAKAAFIGQLITQMGIARRAHCDDDPAYSKNPSAVMDSPSCPPGYLTRIGSSGNGHPIAHVTVTEDIVPRQIQILINERAQTFFKQLPDLATKELALMSLNNISSAGIAQEILDDEEEVSHAERNLREKAIEAFGLRFNVLTHKYEIKEAIYTAIETEVMKNAVAIAYDPRLVNGAKLSPEGRSEVLYHCLDPVTYYHDVIQSQFERSLTAAELEAYKKKQVPEPTVAQARTLASVYDELFQKETADAKDDFYELNEGVPAAVLAFRKKFEPGAVTLRIIKKLKAEGIFGSEEAIVRGVAQIQKKKLLDQYLRGSLVEHDQKRNKTYHSKQATACTAALADSRLDWKVLTEKEKNDMKSALMDELTVSVLGGLEGIQSLSPSTAGRDHKDVKEEFEAVGQMFFVRQDTYIGVGNARFRQSLGVPNTGPTGKDSGVMGMQIGYPRMPVIHSYRPAVGDNPRVPNGDIPTFSIAMAFPRGMGTVSNLPAGVLKLLTQHKIANNNVEVFWLVQDMLGQGGELIPQPWLHPNAPQERGVTQSSNILVGICDVNSSMSSVTPIRAVSTRPDMNGQMVYSEGQMPIVGIEAAPNNSHSFYSLCIDPGTRPGTGRAALTLHWLLNAPDKQQVQAIVDGAENIAVKDLVEFLSVMLPPNSTIVGSPLLENRWTPLKALGALIQGAQLKPTNAHEPRYRLRESVAKAVVPATQRAQQAEGLSLATQRAHKLAEALFLEKRFSEEPNLERRRKLLLTAMDEAQSIQNPVALVPGTQEFASEEVSPEQQNRYFQLLLKTYLEASILPEELSRLKGEAPPPPQPVKVTGVAVAPVRPVVVVHAAPAANAPANALAANVLANVPAANVPANAPAANAAAERAAAVLREAEARREREERARQDAVALRAREEAAARAAEAEARRVAAERQVAAHVVVVPPAVAAVPAQVVVVPERAAVVPGRQLVRRGD